MKATTILLLTVWAAPAIAQPALSPAEPTTAPSTAPATQPASVVTLRTGERVAGTIVERDAERVVVESRALGRVTIVAAEVESIAHTPLAVAAATQPAAPPGDAVAGDLTPVSPLSTAPPPPPGDRGLFGTGVLKDWARQVELGFSGASGTTDSISINTQANASINNDVYRSTLGASYFFDESDGTVGRNQTRVFGTVDRRLGGGPWFVFGRSQYDNDSLQNWENRISVYGGPGYEFYKRPEFELLGRVGVGYTTEFGGTYPDGYDYNRVEALVGLDGKWKINATSGLVFSSYYTPSIEDFMAEGRVVTTFAYQADFATYRGLGFKTGFEHAYEFRTAGDDEHNNWKYFANLVFKL